MEENFYVENRKVRELYSCDTFVVLPPGTNGSVIFGKNSDRPAEEVQEVVYVPAEDHPQQSKLKCTYIEIEQCPHTYAVILSKPSFMWGAEMGANEYGVCIGNEAVWTKLNGPSDSVERLLGMDLLRLGLERSSTALEAVHVLCTLLEEYGQGGNCSDIIDDFTYHNSFLIADPTEAYILETADRLWAVEKVTTHVRNISNELSIGTNIYSMSKNLLEHAKSKNLWHPDEGPFNFKVAYGIEDGDESYRYSCGKRLLNNFSKSGNFNEHDMFKVLRDKGSGICMSSGSFVSTGSQVSVLSKNDSSTPSIHWFTATPDPQRSVFKPFVFTDGIEFPSEVVSPIPRKDKDYRHDLYKLQENYRRPSKSIPNIQTKLHSLEDDFVKRVNSVAGDYTSKKVNLGQLFKEAVEQEMMLYK